MKEKLMIYQVFPRILTNTNTSCKPFGTLAENGCGKMAHFTPQVIRSIKELGMNTIWFTGIIEHATKTDFADNDILADNPYVVKGEAGSPYAIKDYYDVAPSLAMEVEHRMEEFEQLVGRVHDEGMKIIIDFVPNHTAREYHSDSAPSGVSDFGAEDNTSLAFKPDNNYYYIPGQQFAPWLDLGRGKDAYTEFPAKATGNDCFSARCGSNDWYETVKLNYGHDYTDGTDHFNPIPDTWKKMLDIVMFWASKGIDGFRCDMVFMVPLEFWHWMIPQVKELYPDLLFMGEIYDPALYRPFIKYGGFDYLYDKVGLYDTLVAIEKGNASAADITSRWKELEGISENMVNFLENHDEVRFASKEFAANPMRCIPALTVSAMISKGPFILYYGQELGLDGEENEGFAGPNHRTTIFDYWSYDVLRRWYHDGLCDTALLSPHERWLRNTYSKLLKLCNERPEIREGKLFDLTYANIHNPWFDTSKQYAFLRYLGNHVLLIVANFNPEPVYIEVCIPQHAFTVLDMDEGIVNTLDLYSGHERQINLSASEPVKVRLQGSNSVILAFKAPQPNNKPLIPNLINPNNE